MTQDQTSATPSDAELAAYLDGELSPAASVRMGQRLAADPTLKARLDRLLAGGRPFGEAFAPLLDAAPKGQLEAMLHKALSRPAPAVRRWGGAGRLGLVAAAIVTLAVGAGLDHVIGERAQRPLLAARSNAEAAEWRMAVADYLALYTRETLARIPSQSADRDREVGEAGERLGLALSAAKVALADLPLKRADLYDYDGRPLAFLAYLDPGQGPVALCIIAGGDPADPKVERRQDMNVVYWAAGGHSFMLIGRAPADDLQRLAAGVQARFAGDPGKAG